MDIVVVLIVHVVVIVVVLSTLLMLPISCCCYFVDVDLMHGRCLPVAGNELKPALVAQFCKQPRKVRESLRNITNKTPWRHLLLINIDLIIKYIY